MVDFTGIGRGVSMSLSIFWRIETAYSTSQSEPACYTVHINVTAWHMDYAIAYKHVLQT
jgi:hypothetical protein